MDAYELSGKPPDPVMPSESNGSLISGNGLLNDREIFIRNAFTKDPATGCELLFKRYYGVLCSYAVRFIYSKAIAEDIVSEVFTGFWERKSWLQIQRSYRAFLFTMVRNRCLNELKKEFGKNGLPPDPESESAASDDPVLILQADELNQLIEKNIQALPSKCRLVFLMSRLEGMKNMEIAGELKVSVKAVESHITRALYHLRRALQNYEL